MKGKSQIVYPAQLPAPAAPILSEIVAGALAGRTEYYKITYIGPDGESFASDEANLSIDANDVGQIAPPDYPYPFSTYGYRVYGAATSGTEVLQSGADPVTAGEIWTEPSTGLVTGTASPPTSWSSTTLEFGRYTQPSQVPRYHREVKRNSNIAASGLLETIYEHTDNFIELDLGYVGLGLDVDGWNTFITWAERGGIFTFYPDLLVGGAVLGVGSNYTLWDTNWIAAYQHPGVYSFKQQWREAKSA
jgi:hypothetical protein